MLLGEVAGLGFILYQHIILRFAILFIIFQDIEVGKAVRSQLAMRVSDAHAAWKKVIVQNRIFIRNFKIVYIFIIILINYT